MLERLQPAEPRMVSLHLRMPPPPPKLTIHFYNIFFLLDPLLLLSSSFLHLRTSPQFYYQKCPLRFQNPLTCQPLAKVALLTLSGSGSTRSMSGSFHLCSLPSSPTDTTPKPFKRPTASPWIHQSNLITVYLLPFASLSHSKPSSRSLKYFLSFISPQLPTPLASYTPISVGPWPVWAVSTLLLPSPTKYAYFKLLCSKYQLSSLMSKVVLTMSVQTSWLVSSPKEGSRPILLPGLSLSSPNTSACLSSKAHQRSSARSLLAPLRAL